MMSRIKLLKIYTTCLTTASLAFSTQGFSEECTDISYKAEGENEPMQTEDCEDDSSTNVGLICNASSLNDPNGFVSLQVYHIKKFKNSSGKRTDIANGFQVDLTLKDRFSQTVFTKESGVHTMEGSLKKSLFQLKEVDRLVIKGGKLVPESSGKPTRTVTVLSSKKGSEFVPVSIETGDGSKFECGFASLNETFFQ